MGRNRSEPSRRGGFGTAAQLALCVLVAVWTTVATAAAAAAQETGHKSGEAKKEPTTGTFITIRGPVTGRTIAYLRARLRDALQGGAELIVLAVHGSGDSEFEECLKAARIIAGVQGAVTVAYVEGELGGHELMLALAADRIVLHPNATLGPILSRREPPGIVRIYRTAYDELLKQKGRDAFVPVVRAMIDPSVRLLYVKVAEGNRGLLVTDSDRDRVLAGKTIVSSDVIVDVNQLLKLDARRARLWGLAEALYESREAVAEAYGLPLEVSRRERKLLDRVVAARVEVSGVVDYRMRDYLQRTCRELRSRGVNLMFFVIDSPGGLAFVGLELAHFIDKDLTDVLSVAYIEGEGLSAAAFIAFGCDEIVMSPHARLGDCGVLEAGWGVVRYAPEKVLTDVKQQLELLAKSNGYPVALMHAFVDKDIVVVEALNRRTGARGFFRVDELDKKRWQVIRTVKRKGEFLEVDAEKAIEYRLAVATAGNFDQLCELYGVDPARVIRASPTWIDALVYWLTRPFVRFLLMTIGIIALYTELKLPGIGLPLIISLISFTLLFWSLVLHGTATALEILLFLLGIVLIAVEILLVPGAGVFGVSGLLLVVVSLILASQSFLWPANEAEWNELLTNIIAVAGSIFTVLLGMALLARFLPGIPVLGHLALEPPTPAPATGPAAEPGTGSASPGAATVGAELVGAVGVALTPLRPAGRIRIGEELYDVVTRGEFVEAGQSVQVVEIQGNHIVVRPIRSAGA